MKIDRFILYMKNNLLPESDAQEKCGRGEKLWTADNWTIGVSECLYTGIENYQPTEKIYKNYHKDINLLIF